MQIPFMELNRDIRGVPLFFTGRYCFYDQKIHNRMNRT